MLLFAEIFALVLLCLFIWWRFLDFAYDYVSDVIVKYRRYQRQKRV